MICESGLEMVGHSGVPLGESEHEGWVRRGLKGVYEFRFFHSKEDVCPSEHFCSALTVNMRPYSLFPLHSNLH